MRTANIAEEGRFDVSPLIAIKRKESYLVVLHWEKELSKLKRCAIGCWFTSS